VILFPFACRAYDWDRPQGPNSIVDAQGIAKERLAPSGYVQVRGELWKAELMEGSPPLEKGERVRVEGVRGLRLVVVQSTIDEEVRVSTFTPVFFSNASRKSLPNASATCAERLYRSFLWAFTVVSGNTMVQDRKNQQLPLD